MLSISKKENLAVDDILNTLANFYYKNGSGILGKYKAFRWENELIGIENPDNIRLTDIIGYDAQKKSLIENTERFLR